MVLIVAAVSSPVLVPVRLRPVMLPVAATLVGVMSPSVSAIAGVVVGSLTEPEIPFVDTMLTVVTVPVPPALTVVQDVFTPSVVSTLPALVVWDGNRLLSAAMAVVAPVPPCATASVPPSVMSPAVVMGPPVAVKPVVPGLMSTEVTVPAPLGEATVDTAVIRPFVSTVITGVSVVLP